MRVSPVPVGRRRQRCMFMLSGLLSEFITRLIKTFLIRKLDQMVHSPYKPSWNE